MFKIQCQILSWKSGRAVSGWMPRKKLYASERRALQALRDIQLEEAKFLESMKGRGFLIGAVTKHRIIHSYE